MVNIEVNTKHWYYNEVYKDYFRVIKFTEGKRYPYKIEWYFKEEENGNNVTESWFELPYNKMDTIFTRKDIRHKTGKDK